MPEGTYRALLTCGLLRSYPPDNLHCLSPGRLGGLADLGAGVVGEPVAGLDHAFGDRDDLREIIRLLDLEWEIDCVIYLLDPRDPTSSLPGTLALKRECLVKQKPFMGTYASAVEWFSLLDPRAATAGAAIDPSLASALGYNKAFPHETIALVAHDASKNAIVQYATRNAPFLMRFGKRLATKTTGSLLNGSTAGLGKDEEDLALAEAVRMLSKKLAGAGIAMPWVQELNSGPEGGDLQIGEAVAMGLCDATLFFEDPRQPHEHDADIQLFERSARIANHADQLGSPAQLMCLHDPRSATIWAGLWERALDEPILPVSAVTAYRELFDIDLVLAARPDSPSVRTWDMIACEAAWYLLSAIAARRGRDERSGAPKRVVVGAGRSVHEVIQRIDDVGAALRDRVDAHHERRRTCIRECLDRFEERRHRRLVDLLASRKGLTLRSANLPAAMWAIGSVVTAPMIGSHASPDPDREARGNAQLLERKLGGERLRFGDSAFVHRERKPPNWPPAELKYHWHNTDIALMSCGDLKSHWFGQYGKVPLPVGMHDDLVGRAVGDIAGLYLDKAGKPVPLKDYVRLGMELEDLQAVAGGGDGRASILVAGGDWTDGKPPDDASPRARTVLAAIRARAVSVLITDLDYAVAVLREHVRQCQRDASLRWLEPTIGQARAK